MVDKQTSSPPGVREVAAVLNRDAERLSAALPLLENFLTMQWRKIPIFGCVLIGGKSARMGHPKHLVRKNGKTWLAETIDVLSQVSSRVVVCGAGTIPEDAASCIQLADAPDVHGPLAGILAAMRWAPHVSWLVSACDLPLLSTDALNWLLTMRRPGVWAALPRLRNSPGVEPLLAYYDCRSRSLLEGLAATGNFRPADIISHPRVITPEVPARLEQAWRNINAPKDLRQAAVEDLK